MELILCTPPKPPRKGNGIPYRTIVLSSEGPITPYTSNIPTLTVQQLSHNRVRQTTESNKPVSFVEHSGKETIKNQHINNFNEYCASLSSLLCSSVAPVGLWPPAKIQSWQYDASTNEYTQGRNNVAIEL